MAAAGMAGDLRMVQALLDKGADVHARLRETNETAATFAEKYGRTEIARLLRQVSHTETGSAGRLTKGDCDAEDIIDSWANSHDEHADGPTA